MFDTPSGNQELGRAAQLGSDNFNLVSVNLEELDSKSNETFFSVWMSRIVPITTDNCSIKIGEVTTSINYTGIIGIDKSTAQSNYIPLGQPITVVDYGQSLKIVDFKSPVTV